MNLESAQGKSKEIHERFMKVRKMQWKPEVMLTDMAEEVGELANAILVKEGFKSKNRQRAELIDSLCDVLFDIFMIADYYNVDMETEYEKVLIGMKRRIDSGEFEDK